MSDITIDEQITWVYQRRCEFAYNGMSESVSICEAINDNLNNLKSIEHQAAPLEPECVRVKRSMVELHGLGGSDKQLIKYIDALKSFATQKEMELAAQEVQMNAVRYRAEKAEAEREQFRKDARMLVELAFNSGASAAAGYSDPFKDGTVKKECEQYMINYDAAAQEKA